MIKFFYLILFMMILLWGAVSADEPAGVSSFELAPCFGDNMIFQQKRCLAGQYFLAGLWLMNLIFLFLTCTR